MTPVWRHLGAAAGLLGLCLGLAANADAADESADLGAALYRQGVLPGGEVLRGERDAGVRVEGLAAACVTCHRRSGLGGAEGRIVVPPIVGKYLFRPHSTNVHDMTLPHVPGYRSTREPYTPQTLSRAIRNGIDPSGRVLNYLMPRYKLDDATMQSLITYLRGLSSALALGVTDDTLHFATVITPDTDVQQRRAMVEVMNKYFEDKNAFLRGGARRMQASREIEYRVTRRWVLHVWELSGPASTWEQQLESRRAAEPVFAVVSGLGGADWAPVHRFCERAALPCLFPNVSVPVVAENDFYPMYFSRGVYLEADLIGDVLSAWKGSHPGAARLRQVYRDGDVGATAAAALGRAASVLGLAVDNRALRAAPRDRADLDAALRGLDADEALVMWLRPDDVAALPAPSTGAAPVLLSGFMAGLEDAPVPAAWRERVRMSYPFDLPDLRRARMNFALGWFKIRQIPLVNERLQTDTYVACGIVAETLSDMLDSFLPDYLVERVEAMVSHRLTNGYYPRLGLAPGQRFASKGGYVVHFADSSGSKVVADGDWTVP